MPRPPRDAILVRMIMAGSPSDVVQSPILAQPPPVPVPARWQAVKRTTLFCAGTLALVLLAGVVQHREIALPPCGFRTLVGIPCPACGGTRAFAALAAGDAGHALALNPLAVVSAFAIVFSLLVAGLDAALTGGRGAQRLGGIVRGRVLGWGVGMLVVANWAFLIFEGR